MGIWPVYMYIGGGFSSILETILGPPDIHIRGTSHTKFLCLQLSIIGYNTNLFVDYHFVFSEHL